MSRRRRGELAARFRRLPHRVEIHTFTERLEELLAEAAGVVSMAGYNTVVEALSAGIPTLLVPREWPRLEQRIRAERVADRVPEVEWSPVAECSPRRISAFVERALARPEGATPPVSLGGVDRAVNELLEMLGDDRDVAREERLRVSA
jgi:predicted glycosyltransferase